MALRSLGWSTVFDKDWYSTRLYWNSFYLNFHHGDDYVYDNPPDYEMFSLSLLLGEPKDHTKPVFTASPNGTIHLVDCQSRKVLMSFKTGAEPTYAQHHSVDCKYYLDYETDHSLWFMKTNSGWFDFDRRNFVTCDVEEFFRMKHEKYLDGGRLVSNIKTTEYLFDCETLKIIDTCSSDEVRSYQQKTEPVEHDEVVSVRRVDYELALHSKNGNRLWYLRFAHFDAWYEPRMTENMPYVKHYIKVYQVRRPTYLRFLFESQKINISSETRDLLIQDEYEMQDKTQLAMITGSDETDNRVSSEKRLVLDIDEDEDDTKMIKPSETKKKKAKRGGTTINTDEKMKNGSTDKGGNSTNVVEVNGDKDVETEVQNLKVPDLNHSLDRFHFVKHPDFAYHVSKSCVCSLQDLMWVNNEPVQVQLTKKVLKAMELLKPINWVRLKRDLVKELANLHKNGIAHGDLNPHNVYIDINNNAIIPKLPNADISSLTNAAVMAMDWYNMGRIFLFIATNGAHKFCDTSNGDRNNSEDRKDLFFIDDPEARDITSRLLHPNPDLRSTGSKVLSHRLFWHPDRRMLYFVHATACLNAEKRWSDFTKALDKVGKQVFVAVWSGQKYNIYPGLIQAMSDYRREKNQVENQHQYNGYSLCDLLRFIRNSYIHYPELSVEIRQNLGWSNYADFEVYWRSRFPKLLDEVYKVFDASYPWKGTPLEEYHSPS